MIKQRIEKWLGIPSLINMIIDHRADNSNTYKKYAQNELELKRLSLEIKRTQKFITSVARRLGLSTKIIDEMLAQHNITITDEVINETRSSKTP